MKIAIIGTGISGLTAAYILNKNHSISLFEKNDYVGGHTHTHDLQFEGKTWAVDSGFIVYNERTYPNFIALLDKLKVKRQLTRMGFSVTSRKKDLEYAGHSLNALFAQRSNLLNPYFHGMIYNMIRFNKEARKDLASLSHDTTLEHYLHSNNYSSEFVNNYIIPIGAAIWSTIPSMMMKMPAVFFIRFFDNHGLLQIIDRPKWWVIQNGSKSYVDKIIMDFKQKIRLSAPVKNVKREKDSIKICYGTKPMYEESFDAVVFATHSDQCLRLLEKPTKEEREILGSLPYQKNSALLHYDDSILPNRKLAWSSWNYLLDNDDNKPVSLTYNMNILQSLRCNRTFCVTLNNEHLIDQKKIIKRLSYEHPLFTPNGIKAQNRKHEISGKNNTYYCGAYWHNGFHEDGVVSAIEVCNQLGESF